MTRSALLYVTFVVGFQNAHSPADRPARVGSAPRRRRLHHSRRTSWRKCATLREVGPNKICNIVTMLEQNRRRAALHALTHLGLSDLARWRGLGYGGCSERCGVVSGSAFFR